MYITLSSGKEARIHVSHKTFKTKHGERRGTEVKLVLSGRTFKVKAICCPTDNFSKKAGRKYAATKLLERCRPGNDWAGIKKSNGFLVTQLTKQDRATIFFAINPNYLAKPK